MSQVLLIEDDLGTLRTFEVMLTLSGHSVLAASSVSTAVDAFARRHIDVVISDLRLPDGSGLQILRTIRRHCFGTPFVVLTGFGTVRDAVLAVRLGAIDFVEKPIGERDLLEIVERAATIGQVQNAASDRVVNPFLEAHAAARLARVTVRLIDSPTDPKTIKSWSRFVAASSGALRNWCHTAHVTPRRALVFARILRTILISQVRHLPPADLLDVIDRRTVASLLKFAGLPKEFSWTIDEFFSRQRLVSDQAVLLEFKRALEKQHLITSRGAANVASGASCPVELSQVGVSFNQKQQPEA